MTASAVSRSIGLDPAAQLAARPQRVDQLEVVVRQQRREEHARRPQQPAAGRGHLRACAVLSHGPCPASRERGSSLLRRIALGVAGDPERSIEVRQAAARLLCARLGGQHRPTSRFGMPRTRSQAELPRSAETSARMPSSRRSPQRAVDERRDSSSEKFRQYRAGSTRGRGRVRRDGGLVAVGFEDEELDLEVGADVVSEMKASTRRPESCSTAAMNFSCIAVLEGAAGFLRRSSRAAARSSSSRPRCRRRP